MVEELEGDLQIYQETVHPHYEEQRDKASQLIELVEAKQEIFSRANALKVLKTRANEKYKEGKTAQSNFNKGGDLSKDEFL